MQYWGLYLVYIYFVYLKGYIWKFPKTGISQELYNVKKCSDIQYGNKLNKLLDLQYPLMQCCVYVTCGCSQHGMTEPINLSLVCSLGPSIVL